MDEQKANRGRDEAAQDPAREGGLGSRASEAPGQNKPAEQPDADTDDGAADETADETEGEPSA